MLNSVNITKDIYWVGVNDRRTALFENLWPLEHGMAYNSYLINDEKIALIDTVEGSELGEYLTKIKSIIGQDKQIDYLIVNHMEPDHSGLLKSIVDYYPNIKIVGNQKTFGMINDFYGITENLHIVKDGDIIGTTWGTTIFEIARQVEQKSVYDLNIVQLNGGVSYSETNTFAAEILNYLGKAFNTSPHFLPLPAIVDHLLVKQAIVSDRHIRHVLDLGKQANIVILTVGDRNEDSTLVKAEYFTENDLRILKEKNAVGDICSRMIDIDGNVCHQEIDARTIGVELEDLQQKEYSLLVAGGLNKVEGITGALRGGYANVLITDKFVAEVLLAKVT